MTYNIQSWPTKVQSAKFTERLAYNEAEGGITLPEGWQGRVEFPNGKYRLSLSVDGKRLMLEHFNGTIFTIR